MTRNAWLHAIALTCLVGAGCSKQGDAEQSEPSSAADLPRSESAGSERAASRTNRGVPEYGTYAPGAAVPVGAGPTAASPSPTPTPVSTAQTLTDEQIAKITQVVDSGELAQAKVAKQRAKNAQVKKFASHMITQHKASKRKNTKLVQKQKLEPSDSETSNTLANQASRTLETLKQSEGASFDSEYIAAQVKQHRSLAELLDTRLIPNAASAELKARLEETRAMVGEHLAQAQKIQASLASAAPVATP